MKGTKKEFIVSRILLVSKLLYRDMKKLSLFHEASAMTYITLLSLVPSIATGLSFMSLSTSMTGGENTFYIFIKNLILQKLTEGSSKELTEMLDHLISNINIAGLGFSGLIGFVVTLVMLLRSIELTLNKIWSISDERSFMTRFLHFWTFVTLVAFFGSMFFASFTPLKNVLMGTGSSSWILSLIELSVVFSLLFVLFKWGPNAYVLNTSALIGTVISSSLFLLSTSLFKYYIALTAQSRSIYGVLASLPVFLIWIYLAWSIILMGALFSNLWQQGIWYDSEGRDIPFQGHASQQDRFKSLLPCLVLIWLHKEFLDGKIKDFDGKKLHETLKLPISWIKESLQVLEKKNYISIIEANQGTIEDYFYKISFLPVKSSESILITDLFDDILQPIEIWLNSWKNDLPHDVLNIFNSLFNSQKRKNRIINLRDLILDNKSMGKGKSKDS